ncbi:class I SAM-dependent methyltransferase [Brumimicrobium aurantiacum]|uniref:Class I SAM-dependent methyltransferase n=1 Tax=Brumimicrobium aurantiacum TaxID=1737063 RepID=A0A3E1EZD0_9FLAO|nr:class I SAM-dependent methyltransferase [Brumimicrobium aurantiacum]RFC54921.1 class I SAM-dependent methyltransferase [Brumimicrobium aurantiacum]
MTKPIERTTLFNTDNKKAIEALNLAHLISFAPYVWEASSLLKEKQILDIIENSDGSTIEEIVSLVDISHYGVRILLEAGLGIGLVYLDDGKYCLTKAGYFFLNDKTVVTNFNFMKDVCYEGANSLKDSIENSNPEGLKVFGEWEHIYEGLPVLPPKAKKSWFEFDHYYSDITFDELLPIVFNHQPKKVMDIGANTGKWTLKCLEYDENVEVGLVDLGVQLNVAKQNIDKSNFGDRVSYHEMDIRLSESKLPEGCDIIWMSQFLDCFSDEQIVSILKKCHEVADENTTVFINETFWDLQDFEISAFALQMTSLYFTTMANGCSQMYDSKVFFELIDQAGFKVVEQYNMKGIAHTLIGLKKK